MMPELIEDFAGRPAAVRTRGLVKRYGEKTALAGLDLTVPEGAVYVLVGPNGAGKTTALATLLDLVPVAAGTVEVFGMEVGVRGPEVRGHIGWVPESNELGGSYGGWRVRELLAFHRTFYPAWDEDYARRLRTLLGHAGGAGAHRARQHRRGDPSPHLAVLALTAAALFLAASGRARSR